MAMPFQQTAPAEVLIEIARCDTVESSHPVFQATVVGVDVLNMEGAPYPRATDRQDLVGHTRCVRKGCIDRGAIGTQHGIGINPCLEYAANMGCIEFVQDDIGHRTTAVSDHQHRHMIRTCAPGLTDATAFAWRAGQMTLSFQ